MRRGGLEVLQLLERRVDGALAGGVPRRVQRHGGQRLREGGEKRGGAAHARRPGSVAARTSRSLDAAARASTARARASSLHPVASAVRAASSSGDLTGSFSLPNNVLPPDVKRSS